MSNYSKLESHGAHCYFEMVHRIGMCFLSDGEIDQVYDELSDYIRDGGPDCYAEQWLYEDIMQFLKSMKRVKANIREEMSNVKQDT